MATRLSTNYSRPSLIPRVIRGMAPLVILLWLVIILVTTLVAVGGDWRKVIPSLEVVAEQYSVSLMPAEAPSAIGMKRMGELFGESDSDNSAMIVLEGEQPLGDSARAYYAGLVEQLRADHEHVRHVQDLWGERLTASSVTSADGKATYVQVYLAGDQGTPVGDESVAAVREIVDRSPPPPGVRVYVTGVGPLNSDLQAAGNDSVLKITIVTVIIIFVMLLLVYRSVATVILLLLMVGFEVAAARGVVAFLAVNDAFVLSTFAVNMLVFLAIAAGTDYGIFFFGRYQEERQAGQSREAAFFATYRSTAPVVLASGMTIAGAILCLSFARLPYFKTMGVPCAIGMVVAVACAVTLVPAGIVVAGYFGLLDPKRKLRSGRWRGIGTAIARWPAPILAAAVAVAAIGLLALPGYNTNYDDRAYMPADIPANQGFVAAERHFSQARLTPDILVIETDRDLRNSADFLTLNKLAKAIFKVKGVSRVQGITRPEGTPIANTSIPFLLSLQSATQVQAQKLQAERTDDLLAQAENTAKLIEIMERQYEVMKELTGVQLSMLNNTRDVQEIFDELRGSVTLFDDFFRPIRNYFYWEPHCYNIPICWAIRSIFDMLDKADSVQDKLQTMVAEMEKLEVILPQILEIYPQQIAVMKTMYNMQLKMHSTMSGMNEWMEENSEDVALMGQAFDAAKNDDTFYLPPEVFENEDFKRAMESFLSPDGKSARYIISHNGDPATLDGIDRIERVRLMAEEALKGTPLENAKIYVTGAASTAKDWRDGSTYDLLIAGIAAICLIFIIMLIVTRALIAALVIVGTVVISLGASFGMSVLVWQYILGIELHWMVMAMSVIILLAVGSDYNLLLVARMKEELGAGINTGLIRAMGGTGKVVTTAGLVFAATMASMVVSDLRIIGQIGTTIGLGLLFDTMIVRSFMTPSIAALLGRWFWWPQVVRLRPASRQLREYGPRPAVRALLGIDDRREDDAPTVEFPKPTA